MEGSGLVVTQLEENPTGTHLTRKRGELRGPLWMRALFPIAVMPIKRMASQNLDTFVEAIATDHLQKAANNRHAIALTCARSVTDFMS
jgi:hypothetical protein